MGCLFLYGCNSSDNSYNTLPAKMSLQIQINGMGSVSSAAANIFCASSCSIVTNRGDAAINLVATANPGFVFSGWQGDCQGMNNCILDTQANRNVTAVFTSINDLTVTLSVVFQGDGSGTVVSNPAGINCTQNCNADFPLSTGTVSFTATADNGSVFAGWSADCANTTSCSVDTIADRNIIAIFNRDNTPAITSFTLINADTDLPIPDYDPLISGMDLPLNQLPTSNLNLRVNTTDNVESVRLIVDTQNPRIENLRPYSLGDNGSGDYGNWPLGPGPHQIVATPFTLDNAQGVEGETVTLRLNLVDSQLSLSSRRLEFSGVSNGAAINAKSFSLRNYGNTQMTYSVSGAPSWLTILPATATLAAGDSSAMSFQVESCTVDRTDHAEVTIFAGEYSETVNVSRVCSPQGSVDFSLERFYISQAVPAIDSAQNATDRVSLVANRAGLGRAFVSANDDTELVPNVVFNYRLPNGSVGQMDLTLSARVPLSVDEGQLQHTFNIPIDRSLLVGGIEFYVEVDPDNLIAEIDETNNRFPQLGYFRPALVSVETFEVTIVPIIYNGEALQDTSVERFRSLMQTTQKLYPLTDIDIEVHAPLVINDASWEQMLRQVANLRIAEGSSRAYHGIIRRGTGNNTAGIGYIGGYSAVSLPSPRTIAHEFGHNFGLSHAPCGAPARVDVNFPYPDARIGVWGYDLTANRLVDEQSADVMSYCAPSWISDYNYKRVATRLAVSNNLSALDASSRVFDKVLIVEGDVNSQLLTIQSLYTLTAPAVQPQQGPYLLRVLDAQGNELTRQSFSALPVSHQSVSHFAVSVGLSDEELTRLSRIEMSLQGTVIAVQQATAQMNRPDSAVPVVQLELVDQATNIVALVWDTSQYDAVVVRDPVSQQVLGFDRTGQLHLQPQSDQLELVLSAGLNSTTHILNASDALSSKIIYGQR